jgi:hypothetical protein
MTSLFAFLTPILAQAPSGTGGPPEYVLPYALLFAMVGFSMYAICKPSRRLPADINAAIEEF